MPKQTFFNLPVDKKQTLIRAVKEEFSKSPLAEASITNIVTNAKIPRGSFYQYFEDKEDAYFYVLSKITDQLNQQVTNLLKQHEGDLFETMLDFFQVVIQDKENYDILKHAFLNLNYKVERIFAKAFYESQNESRFSQWVNLVDLSKFNITDEKQFLHIMKMVTVITFHNFIEKFAHHLSDEEAVENFKFEIELLKHGLVKK